jgi:hypothetical protein
MDKMNPKSGTLVPLGNHSLSSNRMRRSLVALSLGLVPALEYVGLGRYRLCISESTHVSSVHLLTTMVL